MIQEGKPQGEMPDATVMLIERITRLEEELERLRESENRYRTIVEKTREVIFVIKDETMVFLNQPELMPVGYTLRDLAAKPFIEFVHPDDRDMVSERHRQRLAGSNPPSRYAFRLLARDGSVRWVELFASLIEWDGGPATLNLLLDITERIEAEEQRRTGEEAYRMLTERINDVVWMADLEMRTYYNSPSIEKILGYTPEERNLIPLEKVVTPATLKVIRERMAEELANESSLKTDLERSVALEMEYYHKDGSTRWMENHVMPIRDRDGNITGIYGVSRDISTRKEAENEREAAIQALRESEERYREILNNIQETYYETDLKGNVTFLTHSAIENLRYSSGELKHINFRKLVATEDLEKVKEAFKEVHRTGEPLKGLAWQVVASDGSYIPVESSISLKRNAAGEPQGFRGIVRDVTESKQAEEALRASEEKYRLVVERANDVFWTFDLATWCYSYVSPSAERLYGLKAEKMMSMRPEDYYTPETAERVMREFGKLRRGMIPGDRLVLEAEHYTPEGGHVWMEISALAVRNEEGAVIAISGVNRDITDRKRAEIDRERALEALRESEDRYRAMFQTSPDSIALTRLADNLLFDVNEAFLRITGYTREEVVGKSAEQISIWLDPHDRVRFVEILREKGFVHNMEARFRMKDGRITTDLVSASILTINGEPHIQTITRDITDMKEMEAQREADREERIKLERQLARAQKLESVGTLAGGIAHDFNNLLMGIQGHASMMLRYMDSSNEYFERLRHIEELVDSGAGLTSQLLGFARGGRYEMKALSLNDVMGKTSEMFGRTRKEIAIHKQFQADLWSVEADPVQMEQVFMNLYVNAWQAMPGGGELFLETENVFLDQVRLEAFGLEPGRYVRLSVTDTGVGMDDQTRERIFDPFFSTKAMGRGSGLGLATVYGIITGHRGVINVYSEPGVGSTFTIYLPASDKSPGNEKRESGEDVLYGHETILLVDDESMVLDVSRELLESLGYRVLIAGSGQEAIAVYRENKDYIDLVILDMIMPGISGAETFEQLRDIRPEVRVILSSGYSLGGEAKSIMSRGCDGFLQKPFRLRQLSLKIREVLGRQGSGDGFHQP